MSDFWEWNFGDLISAGVVIIATSGTLWWQYRLRRTELLSSQLETITASLIKLTKIGTLQQNFHLLDCNAVLQKLEEEKSCFEIELLQIKAVTNFYFGREINRLTKVGEAVRAIVDLDEKMILDHLKCYNIPEVRGTPCSIHLTFPGSRTVDIDLRKWSEKRKPFLTALEIQVTEVIEAFVNDHISLCKKFDEDL